MREDIKNIVENMFDVIMETIIHSGQNSTAKVRVKVQMLTLYLW